MPTTPRGWLSRGELSLSGNPPGQAKTSAKKSKSMARLSRFTLQDQAYEAIRNAMESGQFSPGSPVLIGDLAQQLGISATPVREALNRLNAEQALEMLSSRVLAIPTLSRSRILELRDLRMLIEGFVTEVATAKATKEDCDELETLYRKMIHASDTSAYLRLNRSFHFRIYGLAEMPLAQHLIDLLWLQSGPTFVKLMLRDLRVPLNEFHLDVVNAMRAGDAKAAGEAVRADIRTAAKILAELTEEGLANRAD